MQIQVLSEYSRLAQAGRVKPLACPNHLEDKEITFELTHTLSEKEEIVLQCFACGYKHKISFYVYQDILNRVLEAHKNEPKKED
jgi:hypothetical protein